MPLPRQTYGLIAGGLLGGPVARWLIERHNITIEASEDAMYTEHLMEDREEDTTFTSYDFLKMLALVLVMMSLGSLITTKIKEWYDFSLPGYVAAMFVAVVFRNINDHMPIVKLRSKAIDLISDVSLRIFSDHGNDEFAHMGTLRSCNSFSCDPCVTDNSAFAVSSFSAFSIVGQGLRCSGYSVPV